jgi:hypothetical protein
MSYKVILIDPRPASKDVMIELLKSNAPVVGVEFTLPALIQYIDSNIDDQHVSGSSGKAAISMAATMDLPAENTTFAIVRADADALGAVAVLNLRVRGESINPERIAYIAEQDTFAHGAWTGPRPIVVEESRDTNFSTLGVLAFNFKTSIDERVARFEQWLLTGMYDGMEEDKNRVLSNFRTAVEQTTVSVDGNIALVESRNIGATAIGYHYAPILIIRNDAFRFGGGEAHTKYTLCSFTDGYVSFGELKNALNAVEKNGTWGGSATILGSPQGVSSSLSMDEVVSLVKQFLV